MNTDESPLSISRLEAFAAALRERDYLPAWPALNKRQEEWSVMCDFVECMEQRKDALYDCRQLPEGQDPPDFVCRDSASTAVGVELTRLIDEDLTRENAYRRKQFLAGKTHEHSITPLDGTPITVHYVPGEETPPPSIPRPDLNNTLLTTNPGFAELARHNPAYKIWSPEEALQHLQARLESKDANPFLATNCMRRLLVLYACDDQLVNCGFREALSSMVFGPLKQFTEAYVLFGDVLVGEFERGSQLVKLQLGP